MDLMKTSRNVTSWLNDINTTLHFKGEALCLLLYAINTHLVSTIKAIGDNKIWTLRVISTQLLVNWILLTNWFVFCHQLGKWIHKHFKLTPCWESCIARQGKQHLVKKFILYQYLNSNVQQYNQLKFHKTSPLH